MQRELYKNLAVLKKGNNSNYKATYKNIPHEHKSIAVYFLGLKCFKGQYFVQVMIEECLEANTPEHVINNLTGMILTLDTDIFMNLSTSKQLTILNNDPDPVLSYRTFQYIEFSLSFKDVCVSKIFHYADIAEANIL